MNNSPTDAQLTALYRNVLVPWEGLYAPILEDWRVEELRSSMPHVSIELSSVDLLQVESSLNEHIQQGTINFFVFVRRRSQGRDLFNHIRNAIAHAGITRHKESSEMAAVLRFRSPCIRKKSMTMAGQFEEDHLQDLIDAMSFMAKQAYGRGGA